MKKAGQWLTWSGLALGIVTVVVGIVLAVVGFGKVADLSDGSFRVDGPTEYVAEADSVLVMYHSDVITFSPTCTATGPAPPEVDWQRTDSIRINNLTVVSFQSFRFVEAGTYTIACDAPGVIAGPKLSVTGIFAGVGGILVAAFGGGIGFVMLMFGAILWAVGASKAKSTPNAPWPPGLQGPPYDGGHR